jgi:hypothetical protein
MPAKRLIIDDVVLQALTVLGNDLGQDLQHRRPVGLKAALKQSLRQVPVNGARGSSPAWYKLRAFVRASEKIIKVADTTKRLFIFRATSNGHVSPIKL